MHYVQVCVVRCVLLSVHGVCVVSQSMGLMEGAMM